MSYLNKDERKKLILDVAKSIALEEGLNTLTVRHIAAKASLSVGLIHHHFSSILALKSEVFIQLAYQNLDIDVHDHTMNWQEKILNILGFIETQEELSYIRLWNDAEKISHSSADFSKVYWLAIETWKKQIVSTLQSIKFKNPAEDFDKLAWQLIGLTLGFERLAQCNSELFSFQYMSDLILQIIEEKVAL